MSNTSRIAKNTIALYFRQILIMLVSLYTVRVVLNVLGAEDYGIYNVVAGVVTMFGFLSGAMATASQRFFSFEMGKKEKKADSDVESVETTANPGLSRIFSVTLTIYALLALCIVVLAETVGLWFVFEKLVIPSERLFAAKCVYQCAVASFLFTIMTTPYMSAIIAHENMNVYAYVSIVEAVLKLVIVFVLQLPDKFAVRHSGLVSKSFDGGMLNQVQSDGFFVDKLILYGILLLCVSAVNTSLYRFYCKKHYAECRFSFLWDKSLFKEMTIYVGWNMFGSAVGVFKNQIINILLNQFFGAVVNAARAIASQVNAAVVSFSANFSTAIRPQIIKSYAAKEKEDCTKLVLRGCRMTFFLMFIFTLPLELEMPFVLKVWLKNPPENAVLFARLVLIDALIDSVSYPVMTLAQATGKIKLYQSVVGGILLLNFPVSFVCLKFGGPAYSVLVVAIFIALVAFAARLLIVRQLTEFSIRLFLKDVFLRVVVVALLSAVVPFAAEIFLKNEILRFFAVVILSVLFTAVFVLFVGMNRGERNALFDVVRRRVHYV